jgi:hypothetical protein
LKQHGVFDLIRHPRRYLISTVGQWTNAVSQAAVRSLGITCASVIGGVERNAIFFVLNLPQQQQEAKHHRRAKAAHGSDFV